MRIYVYNLLPNLPGSDDLNSSCPGFQRILSPAAHWDEGSYEDEVSEAKPQAPGRCVHSYRLHHEYQRVLAGHRTKQKEVEDVNDQQDYHQEGQPTRSVWCLLHFQYHVHSISNIVNNIPFLRSSPLNSGRPVPWDWTTCMAVAKELGWVQFVSLVSHGLRSMYGG